VEVRRGGRAIQSFGPGSHFSEMSLVEMRPRLATAVARGPSTVVLLSRRTFEWVMRMQPAVSAKLMRNLVRILSARLLSTNDELVVLKTHFDTARLALPAVLSPDALQEDRGEEEAG